MAAPFKNTRAGKNRRGTRVKMTRTRTPAVRRTKLTAPTNMDRFVLEQRERLESHRNGLLVQQDELEELLVQVDTELAALDQYDAARRPASARSGQAVHAARKPASASRKPRLGKPKGRGSQKLLAAPRRRHRKASGDQPRVTKRDEILQLIQKSSDGISRGDIIAQMGFRGDKSREGTVSNALTALIRNEKIVRMADHLYVPANA